MNKGKSITLLSIIGFIMAVLIALTFLRFPVGVYNFNGVLGGIDKDYSLTGGYSYTLSLSHDNIEEVEDIEEVCETIGYRMRALGYEDYNISYQKENKPGVEDYDIIVQARAKLNDNGKQNETQLFNDVQVAAKYGEVKIYGGTEANPTEEIFVGEKVIEKASYTGPQSSGGTIYYNVGITFTKTAHSFIMDKLNEGAYYLSIQLAGEELLSGASALSKDYFQNRTVGLNAGSDDQAKQIALLISSGGLAYMYDVADGVEVASPYGENTAKMSVLAVGLLLLLIVVAFIIIYKGFGIISGVALLAVTLLELLMLIAIPNIRLAIGGVVGIALSIIIATDGLIIISKRIAEEYANGKTVKACFSTGMKRSLKPILLINSFAIVISLLLFAFSFGAVKNFAITLAIGSVITLIINLLFVRLLLVAFLPLVKNTAEKFFNFKREKETV